MNTMRTVLLRSHWTELVVGVCNLNDRPDPIWATASGCGGWETGLDGGGNTHSPSEWGIVFSRAHWDEKGIEDIWVLRVHERFSQEHNDHSWEVVFRYRDPSQLGEFVSFWEEDSFWWEEIAPWRGDDPEKPWERVENPPPDVLGVLHRALALSRQSWGQGNQDGLFGYPPASAGEDITEVTVVPRATRYDEEYESEV
jgi:hypothetical protein